MTTVREVQTVNRRPADAAQGFDLGLSSQDPTCHFATPCPRCSTTSIRRSMGNPPVCGEARTPAFSSSWIVAADTTLTPRPAATTCFTASIIDDGADEQDDFDVLGIDAWEELCRDGERCVLVFGDVMSWQTARSTASGRACHELVLSQAAPGAEVILQ